MENLDHGIFKLFTEGTQKTLKVQCSVETKAGTPFVRTQEKKPNACDIVGVIGLNSKKFTGTLSLCFDQETFLEAMQGMLGESFKEISDELADGVAELLNIIFGQAKATLNDQGQAFQMAIPTVIRGKCVEVLQAGSAPTVVLPFETKKGNFYLQITHGGTA